MGRRTKPDLRQGVIPATLPSKRDAESHLRRCLVERREVLAALDKQREAIEELQSRLKEAELALAGAETVWELVTSGEQQPLGGGKEVLPF